MSTLCSVTFAGFILQLECTGRVKKVSQLPINYHASENPNLRDNLETNNTDGNAYTQNSPRQYRRLEAEAIKIQGADKGSGRGQYRRLAEAIKIQGVDKGGCPGQS